MALTDLEKADLKALQVRSALASTLTQFEETLAGFKTVESINVRYVDYNEDGTARVWNPQHAIHELTAEENREAEALAKKIIARKIKEARKQLGLPYEATVTVKQPSGLFGGVAQTQVDV